VSPAADLPFVRAAQRRPLRVQVTQPVLLTSNFFDIISAACLYSLYRPLASQASAACRAASSSGESDTANTGE